MLILTRPTGFALCFCLLLTSCAGTSVFNPYPEQAAAYRAAISNGTIEQATSSMASKLQSKDKLLYLCESGRLHQLNKQYKASLKDFEQAIAIYQAQDDKAIISAGQLASGSPSLVSNDNAIPYNGAGYERILVHHFQAFNYLGLGDIEGASVEIRRAAQEQRVLELANDKVIEKAKDEASREKIDLGPIHGNPMINGMDKIAGKVKSAFQNAYTFYASAVLWEAQGDLNSALVDYKKAWEINPDNALILEDIKRVDANQRIPSDKGTLVVFYEDGFVASKQGVNISLPYFSGNSGNRYPTYLNIAFPVYNTNNWYYPQTLRLYRDSVLITRTDEIADISAMAVKSLKDQIPGIVVRQFLRARVKHELNQKAAQEAGAAGSILSTLYNLVSEQADRRSWLSLPASVQIARQTMHPGEYNIELDNGSGSQKTSITMRAGKITILRVINANNRLLTESFEI